MKTSCSLQNDLDCSFGNFAWVLKLRVGNSESEKSEYLKRTRNSKLESRFQMEFLQGTGWCPIGAFKLNSKFWSSISSSNLAF